MISGIVTADRAAVVRIFVLGPEGQVREFEVIVDTGFDGYLTLSSSVVAGLGLIWRRRGSALLADGRETVFDSYEASVIWDGQRRRVVVDAVETVPLLGMALLSGYKLTLEAVVGGDVKIERLP